MANGEKILEERKTRERDNKGARGGDERGQVETREEKIGRTEREGRGKKRVEKRYG